MTRDKVLCDKKTFINEVATDCVKKLSSKNKERLAAYPYASDYHFSYCLYIRNHYIYNRDFTDVSFCPEPDMLSGEILKAIFSRIIPEYDCEDEFLEQLFDTKKFVILRKEYKAIYGEYPISIVEKYKKQLYSGTANSTEQFTEEEMVAFDDFMNIFKPHQELYFGIIRSLIQELAELVWQTEQIKETAQNAGIDYECISSEIESFKELFYKEGEYVPLQICFLPYRNKIGKTVYTNIRKQLINKIDQKPSLVERIDSSYLHDRVLARSVLKHGWTLQFLPMYQNDEAMVKWSLMHDGESIQYADKRFQNDRKLAKLAIEHTDVDGSILGLKCMEQYRTDKELVYLSCSKNRSNFNYLSEEYRDDFDLAKICAQQIDVPFSLFECLSERLRDNKELAMLDIQSRYACTEYYSERLRDDDEVAAKLFEFRGINAPQWFHMSERLKEAYGVNSYLENGLDLFVKGSI